MIKVTNIEQVNGVPCVKARVIWVATGGKSREGPTGQIFKTNESLSNPEGYWYNVILVSDTENMNPGDKWFNTAYNRIEESVPDKATFNWKKILASPGNLSQASLELIRAGQIKEGDEVWLEAESNGCIDLGVQENWWEIKLDQDGHVIIYQSQKLPTTYSIADMIKVARRFGNMHTTDEMILDWIRENVKASD